MRFRADRSSAWCQGDRIHNCNADAGKPGSVLKERICSSFEVDGRVGPVAREYSCASRQGEQLVLDVGQQPSLVTMRKVCPTDAAGKQRVADDGHVGLGTVQSSSARRMAGRVENAPPCPAQFERMCFGQISEFRHLNPQNVSNGS